MPPKTYREVRRRVRGRASFSRAGVVTSSPLPGAGLWSWGAGFGRGRSSRGRRGRGVRGQGILRPPVSALGAASQEPGPKPRRLGGAAAGQPRARDPESLPRPAPLPRGPRCKSPAPGFKSRLQRASHLGLGARHGFRRAVPRACRERTPSRSSRPERRSGSVVPAAPWPVPWDRGGPLVAHLQLALGREARLWRGGQPQVARPAAGASLEHVRPLPGAHTGRSRVPPAPAPG
ncbi:unnamed protein product [Gulo gulo]|uniref:Uncharacterized protein n=1 Tax=Gulo gulo TaxID=48420 RepID=A0A9X9Q3E7_GULGU|nr:unnamed protein product [Gulo gulo]